MKSRVSLIFVIIWIFGLVGINALAQAPTDKFNLSKYDKKDLNQDEFKAKSAFIFTLLANTTELRIHQMNGEKYNVVYVKNEPYKGGYPEVVYKPKIDEKGNPKDTGEIVRDCLNMGSFNYKHPSEEPLGHFTYDILPWLMWGNCEEDPSTIDQRVEAYILDIELSLEKLVESESPYYLPKNFKFSKDGQSDAIAFYIKALEKNDFNLYEFIMNGQRDAVKRQEFYKNLKQGFKRLLNENI